jgi:hypothetical protein
MHFAGAGPSGTVGAHPPATHPWPLGHAWPQLPQLALLLVGSTHAPLHAVVVGGHPWVALTHALLAHTWLAAHTMPQPPQLLGSTEVPMHLPLQSDW